MLLFISLSHQKQQIRRGNLTTSLSVILDATDTRLSGRFHPAAHGQPTALLVALHDGGYTSKYCEVPHVSLLELASSLNYAVLALDRTGYGIANSLTSDQLSFDGQVSILRQALDSPWHEFGKGPAGIFLFGHSTGGMLALLIAAENQQGHILVVSMTGAGAVYHSPATAGLEASIRAASTSVDLAELHAVAHAYYLKIIAFAGECILAAHSPIQHVQTQ
jgi:alpha-beta hydrolase superfamily lysophospholipase